MSYWDYLLKRGLQYGARKAGNTALRSISDTYNNIYTELSGIKPLNVGEDKYVKQLIKMRHPMERDISTWDDDDARSVFNNPNYPYNMEQQNKVNQYINYRNRIKNKY